MPKVVLSSNAHPNYFFFIPIVVWAWKQFDFDAVVLMPESVKEDRRLKLIIDNADAHIIYIDKIDVYKEETITQVSRLYAACSQYIPDNEVLITSDIDMLPLSNYFYRDFDKINVFGWDLTNFNHVPICYVSMTKSKWRQIMDILDMASEGDIALYIDNELTKYPTAKSSAFVDWWTVDQQIITDRIKAYIRKNGEQSVNLIKRGTEFGGFPKGRIDRNNGMRCSEVPIDCHMPRPAFEEKNFALIMNLIQTTFPQKDVSWIAKYRNDYMAIT